MEKIITTAIEQWPSISAFALLGLTFWMMFKQHLEENRKLIEALKASSTERSESLNKIVEQYRSMAKDQVSEIDRYRVISRSLIEENEKIGKRYDELKEEFSKVLIENRSLKRTMDRIEEMIVATGSDVKVISKELSNARKDIDVVSSKIFQLPPPDKNIPSEN